MDSWLNMVLLCGLLLLASLQATNALRLRRSKSSKNQILETNIQHLKVHYNISGPEWVGKEVFAPHLKLLNSKASCKCQSLLLEGMLNMYEEIFQDMMNKPEQKDVKDSLNKVMLETRELRDNYKEEQKVWRELRDIHSVKVKNGMIQRGALNDFLMVYYKAMEKPHDKM